MLQLPVPETDESDTSASEILSGSDMSYVENVVPETDEYLNATSHSHHSVEAAVRSKKASHIHAIDDSLAESPVIARNRKKTCAFIVSSDDDDDEGDSLVDHNDDASIDSFIDDRSRTDVSGSPPNNATSSFLSLKDVSMAGEDSISAAKPGGNYGMKETKTTDKSHQERRTSVMSSDPNSKFKKSGDRAYASNDASNLSIEEVPSLIYQKKKLAKNVKLSALPDNGGRLKQQIQELEQSLSDLSMNSSIHESSKSASDRAEESIVVVPSSSEDESADYATPMGKLTRVAESVNRYEPPKSPTLMKRLEDKNDETNEKLIDLKETLEKKKRLFQATNLRALDDGGDKLKKEINDIERELMMLELKADATEIVRHGAYQQYEQKNIGKLNLVNVDASSTTADGARYTKPDLPQNVIDALYSADQNYGARNYGGKISDARERQIVRVTSDTLEAFSQIIRNMPDVENINPDSVQEPRGLRVDLMPHQKRALVWLLWRESQEPPGGILADDMGLGKTLTMLSLILRHKELISEGVIDDFAMETLRDEDQSDEEISTKGGSKWLPRPRKQQLRKTQGTLVVCPASLMGQWEREANDRISRGRLSVLVYHGPRRDTSIGFICKHDVVITTYQLAMKEAFGKGGCSVKEKKSDGIPKLSRSDQGCLYQIGWARIILDEGHCIRNHKSQTAQAMCMLKGGRRWILSGTPVQNKEMDMFSLVRFLRIAPFDEYICWKHQITNSNVQGMRRLTMIVKAILLRRTKDQVDKSSGEKLVKLPDKKTIVHELSLSQEEREIYDRIFRLSRNSLYEYMKTHEEKEREKESKTKDTLSVDVTSADKFRFTPTLGQKDLLDESVKTHHLLVLLLRLRQICCHPTLIKAVKNVDASLLAQLHDMTLQEPDDRLEEVKQRPKAEV
ncbi:hypothetical protein HAZT_HAZT007581 [Hyalella azteca]|uniref:Helicase ATP-binding domain-containing protein n=1 Tax=Hyalella azteca TaxID=294128 RepID=A0A6A0HE07_HYAAZ|nr:hypothetical protein HAZT_HAZT007581 [Hyalella azteca]